VTLANPLGFRERLLSLPRSQRDLWVDRTFGLDGGLPDDIALPMGCVPYLPTPVDTVVRMVAQANVRDSDVFVDIGLGVGRTAALVQLLTGAAVVGLEIQPQLADAARELAARLSLPPSRFSVITGDAPALTDHLAPGTVFFLYCPFGSDRLAAILTALERIAATRSLRVCCVDLPLPPSPWLEPIAPLAGDLAVYRSTSAC
jgi:SAM-dependent methyltransferase